MAGFFGKWSKTAASNATADSTVNWQEGQAPSTVNDSGRAMMASIASFRDDRAGSLICGGTSTAYTLTTNQAFAALADMDGQEISFVVTPTNGDAATLNVNSLGAKALVFSIGNPMPAGSLIDGSIYTATYIHASSCWKVHSPAIGNPYNVPIGGTMDYIGTTVPNSNFVFPYGQQISQTTYAALYALVGANAFGSDGGGLFYLPDCRGRVVAGKDNMGGSSANRLTAADDGLNGDNLGATGGGETQTLVTANLPAYTPAGTNGSISVSTGGGLSLPTTNGTVGNTNVAGGGSKPSPDTTTTWGATTSLTGSAPSFTGTAQGGTSTAFGIVQPTIVFNKILRII